MHTAQYKRSERKHCSTTSKDLVQVQWLVHISPRPCSPVGPLQVLLPQEGVLVSLHQALTAVLFHCLHTAVTPKKNPFLGQCSAVIASLDWEARYRPLTFSCSFWFEIVAHKMTLPLCKTDEKGPTWNTTALLKELITRCQIKSTVHLSNWGRQIPVTARFKVSRLTK